MPRYLIEGSSDGSLFSETVDANSKEDAEAFAIERLCEAWGETYGPDTTLDDLGDAASVTEYTPEDYARDAAPQLLSSLRKILAYEDNRPSAGSYGAEVYAEAERIVAAAEGTPMAPPSANEAESTLSAQVAPPIPAPELPSGVTFNEANLETGMCLWEAMLEMRGRPAVVARFNEVGTVAMRHAVMTLIADCESEWEALGDEQDRHAPYDWDWCPTYLERNLPRLGIIEVAS